MRLQLKDKGRSGNKSSRPRAEDSIRKVSRDVKSGTTVLTLTPNFGE
jgi:hypothetical protein